MSDVSGKAKKATKWSLITEISSKLVAPVVNMVLARVLTPEAFGMVATVTMVTSLADLFTDTGFQKFLIQHDFVDEDSLYKFANVAFWTNLFLSIFSWLLIFVFRNNIVAAIGNPGLGMALAIASLALPMTSFSSIQTAFFRRKFDFKTLFWAKIIGIIIPIFVTVPLALILKNFWAIIYGNLVVNLCNAILLTWRSKWKPRFFFKFKMLKEMFAFSMWTFFEQLLGWANLNLGIFVVGLSLSTYYVGIYKTSMTTANQIIAIFTNAFSPVLVSALSRLKENQQEFNDFFYKFVKNTSIIILPLGVGMFIYRELLTSILLGSQWDEAADFIGLWALVRSFYIIFGFFAMEAFVSSGKPKYSVLSQFIGMLFLIPALAITSSQGYQTLFVTRSLLVIADAVVRLILLYRVLNISAKNIICNVWPFLGASLVMGSFGFLFVLFFNSYIIQFVTCLLCVVIYFGILLMFKCTRRQLLELVEVIKK